MGKKLDRLVARVQALEEAIAAMLTGKTKKKPKTAKNRATKKKNKRVVAKPAKTPAKASAPKKARRRVKKAAPVTPLPLTATL